MIIRWGRKGLVAGAYAVTFATAVSSVNYINEVQARPSFKQEVKFVTPTTSTINLVQFRPNVRFEFRYITPSSVSRVGVKHYRKKIVEDDLDKFLLPWEIEDKNKTVIVEKQKTGKFAKKQVIVHNTLEAEYITELKAEQKRKRRKKAIAMLLESL